MTKRWACYAWQGPRQAARGTVPAEDWRTPEGAVEFLRRALSDHGLYSRSEIVAALGDLRKGRPVAVAHELADGGHLHIEILPPKG
ncbi:MULTISPECIES: hypothetical protein [Actinomadura]|uniref:Uncharacterized protein n=1 Tax=Actinomadura yumaensis TaxID=111807 RepID=A0ABW2D0C7_9ACTN|nr:hypothetical protein [Actinomadura sp. J1-007]MWK38000.1 hypothetical protein [Actinomadura sp. J1-007]